MCVCTRPVPIIFQLRKKGSSERLHPRNETIKTSGSLDKYLANQLEKKELPSTHLPKPPANHCQSVQERAIEFYKFVEDEFPPEPGVLWP